MRIVVNYAYDRNIINKKCTDGITFEYSEPTFERIPFAESEIQKLWDLSDQWDVKVLLILLYSGLRVNELLKNDRANVNLEERWIYIPRNLAKKKVKEKFQTKIRYLHWCNTSMIYLKNMITKNSW